LPVQSIGGLKLSASGLGDALIFPMFRQKDNWGTEFVVRNTDQNHAIVAKVAVYEEKESEEVLDFNVYLSAADVVRFKIQNGFLTSEDGSVLRVFPAPSSNLNDVSRSDFASPSQPFTKRLPQDLERGYVVVYGMAQASTEDDALDSFDMRYHNRHPLLFKNYRRELDACRPGWRFGHQNGMVNGTYTKSVAAPNQAANCNFINSGVVVASVRNANLESFRATTAVLTLQGVAVQATTAEATATAKEATATAIEADGNATQEQKDAARADANLARDAADNAQQRLKDAAVAAANQAEIAANAAVDLADAAQESNNNAADSARRAAQEAKRAATNVTDIANAATTPLTQEQVDTVASIVNSVAIAVAGSAARVAQNATDSAPGNFFGDVAPSLAGTVRLFNGELEDRNGVKRPVDMLLPATAIENFTSGNKIIYTEGEIAALQDRRIKGTTGAGTDDAVLATYNEEGIRADARAFVVKGVSYNFAAKAGSIANQLVITQPYKRVLVQLGNDDRYWQGGSFSFIYNVFNEQERMDNISYTDSPHTSSGIEGHSNELEVLRYLEKDTEFDGENGFALLHFIDANGQDSGIPAIITQMIGTTVSEAPQLNWIYSQTQK